MWREADSALVRDFKFRDFKEAFGFMRRVAELAEELDHHPWWSNNYNEVVIKLSTHSAGGKVTEKDTEMADRISEIWKELRAS